MSEKVKKLTGKQLAFKDEYINDFNSTRAAKAAGYSAKTAAAIGYENLRKPQIQEAIREAIEAREKRVHRTGDEVVNLLWAAVELDPIEYCKIRRRRRSPDVALGRDQARSSDHVEEDQAETQDY